MHCCSCFKENPTETAYSMLQRTLKTSLEFYCVPLLLPTFETGTAARNGNTSEAGKETMHVPTLAAVPSEEDRKYTAPGVLPSPPKKGDRPISSPTMRLN